MHVFQVRAIVPLVSRDLERSHRLDSLFCDCVVVCLFDEEFSICLFMHSMAFLFRFALG